MKDDLSYYKKVVETVQEGVMIVDPNGKILSVNPATEKLTGYTAEELVGKSCRILDCSGCEFLDNELHKAWCKLFVDECVIEKECTIVDKQNKTIHVSKNASVLRDQNGIITGAVETITDISEKIKQQKEIYSLRKTLSKDSEYQGIMGQTEIMQRLFGLIDNVAQTDAPVLILGPSGTGKELVARAIHESGNRRSGPFIKVNCAALNENLLESELFGHVKGAYSGADRNRMGRFEAAHNGTIFLDEIGDVPLPIQVKLLRVLEEKEIEHVGDHKPIPINVRILTATNKDLDQMIEREEFREDLYFRINVFPIQCPALKERRDDISSLAQKFIKENGAKSGKDIIGVTPEVMEALTLYDWPGNVRELRNAIDYSLVLCQEGLIKKEHLPPKVIKPAKQKERLQESSHIHGKEQLMIALRKTGGNQSKAAEILGVSRITVWKRIKKYGINVNTIKF
ncbi:MAG: sigma 54-interacting transcriptional regulator [Deltaproteobacteria bacterium]|nr:sigma 54-interacting transcriptional regulator [Deltaproteobacteria bacterium]